MHITFIFDNIILSHQPLGASYISAVLKEAGHDVSVINADQGDYIEKIRSLNPEVVAYTLATTHAPSFYEINREIKKHHNCLSLFGGPHPIFFPQMIEEEGVDVICTGEGEYPTLELITALEEGRDYTQIPSITAKVNGRIFKNANRPFLKKEELNDLPFPDRELIRDFEIWNHRTGYVMAGRGCPYNCSYCFNHASRLSQPGRWTRQRSVDNVIAELRWLKEEYKVIYNAFQDDTFILNERWLEEFLRRYKTEIGLPFVCNVRCDLTSEKKVRMLAEAGCIRAATGIENGDDHLRRTILSKNVTTDQIIQACDLYNRYGIKIIGQNMFGVPGETVETALSTVELNLKCRTHTNTFSFYGPYPGTKLGDLCKEQYGFSGDLNELPREYQDCLAPSIQLENKELIEKIGQCAHLFMSYPRVFSIVKRLLPLIPSYKLKLMLMEWLARIKRELIKKGIRGLPSVWHDPQFIADAIHAPQPEIPRQPVMREKKREAA
ncbi:MAG: B12-binding domain-containing radical SAM protein [Candidatus Omnitrophica bacterium]|nr:B12-binding domain-containing radical SAM protein [Candidatus Omnitrophota bacterium]